MPFCCLQICFLQKSVLETSFRNAIRVLNNLDPDQLEALKGLFWVNIRPDKTSGLKYLEPDCLTF